MSVLKRSLSSAINDWHVDQMDAVTAFLNAPMTDDEIYVRVPEGFRKEQGTVLRLRKAIYGLKQSPRYWNQLLHSWLLERGLCQSQHDPCSYFIPENCMSPSGLMIVRVPCPYHYP